MKRITFFISFLFYCNTALAQQPLGFELIGSIYESGDSRIELWIKKPKNSCGLNSKPYKYILQPINAKKIASLPNRYISWKLNVINCSGIQIVRAFSVNINDHLQNSLEDTYWEKMDYNFEADIIEPKFFSNSLTSKPLLIKDEVLGPKILLLPADSIVGKKEVLKFEEVKLNVKGGPLPQGANWYWYKDACQSESFLGVGSEIKVIPEKTTTYFVSARDGLNTTKCTSFTIIVNNDSKPPTKILSDGDDFLCAGQLTPKKLFITDGKLGYKAKWVWYKNNLNKESRIAENTTFINVSPIQSSTYYVRAESDESKFTNEIKFDLRVLKMSIQPLSIEITKVAQICDGDTLSLIAKGGILAENANWKWTSKSLTGITEEIGLGSIIKIIPLETKTYSVFASGLCDNQNQSRLTLQIDVKKKSISPLDSQINVMVSKNSRKNIITINGGLLGYNSDWYWYKDQGGLYKIGNGNVIETKALKTRTLYVRAEGDCNVTNMVSKEVVGLPKRKFTFFTGGILSTSLNNDTSRISNLFFSFGTQGFYIKTSLRLPSLFGNKDSEVKNPTYISNDDKILNYPSNTGTYYQFNDKYYSNINIYTIGALAGKSWFKFYIGAGYGSYKLFSSVNVYKYSTNQISTVKWTNNTSRTINGPCLESGVFIKLGVINLMGGINGIYSFAKKQQFINGQLGIGLAF